MKRLWQTLRSYRIEAILGPFFKLLEALFELFVPLVVADTIDRGIANGDRALIVSRFLILIALGVIGIVCSVTAQYFAAKASVGTATRLRHDLYVHIQRLSFSDLDKTGTPTLITRLTGDVNQVQNGLNLALRLLLRSPFVVFGAMIMAFTLDGRSALIFLGVIVLLAVVVAAVMSLSVPAFRTVQGKLDELTGTTRENLTGARVIRAFGMEASERAKFADSNDALNRAEQRAGRISALMNPLTYVILNIGIVVLLWFAGKRVNAGTLTTGETVALYNYMTQILVELIKFANLIVSISKAVTCMKRIDDVLTMEPGMQWSGEPVTDDKSAPVIEFHSVSLRYADGGDDALTDLTFSIDRGETVGIIGGTGSGKTSLVNLILRFYDASDGEVLVGGVNVRDYPAEQLRDRIGYVLQRARLTSGTIRENLTAGRQNVTDDELVEAIHAAQADNILAAKENGLDSAVEQNGRNFSGGQRQRLTIARALVRRPEILILDDSASALDLATDAALRRAIRELAYHPTTLIVSQRTASIRDADKILVLDDGRLVGIGTHESLLETCEVYREIEESQTKKEAVR